MIIKLLMNEIENQIEDRVVPVIETIIGPDSRDSRSDEYSRLESYERNIGEESPYFNDDRNSTNERNHDLRVPYVQEENGFI
jgi:hypothetical protein